MCAASQHDPLHGRQRDDFLPSVWFRLGPSTGDPAARADRAGIFAASCFAACLSARFNTPATINVSPPPRSRRSLPDLFYRFPDLAHHCGTNAPLLLVVIFFESTFLLLGFSFASTVHSTHP